MRGLSTAIRERNLASVGTPVALNGQPGQPPARDASPGRRAGKASPERRGPSEGQSRRDRSPVRKPSTRERAQQYVDSLPKVCGQFVAHARCRSVSSHHERECLKSRKGLFLRRAGPGPQQSGGAWVRKTVILRCALLACMPAGRWQTQQLPAAPEEMRTWIRCGRCTCSSSSRFSECAASLPGRLWLDRPALGAPVWHGFALVLVHVHIPHGFPCPGLPQEDASRLLGVRPALRSVLHIQLCCSFQRGDATWCAIVLACTRRKNQTVLRTHCHLPSFPTCS